jgi:hypothetical protein
MDGDPQPQPPRIQQNPHLAECPDFNDDAFDILIQSMTRPDRTREQAVEDLKAAWHTQNDRRKALWDAQLLAAQNHQNHQPPQAAAAVNQPQAADEAGDARKKPKLGAFAATASIGSEISSKPSTFAINKLRDMKYIELYCFTPAGCRDHAGQRLSTADEAFGFTYGISPDGSANSSLTLKPVSALAHPGKIIPDENLTWEQVRDAKPVFLSHVMEAEWDRTHVNALVSFFINLDSHPYNNTPEGKQALVWYQAHAREDWHRKLGSAESFNLAILNSTLLADFKKKANDLSVQNNVAQVSSLSPPYSPHHNSLTSASHSHPTLSPTHRFTSHPLHHAPHHLTPPIGVLHTWHPPPAHHALHLHAPPHTHWAARPHMPPCTPRAPPHPLSVPTHRRTMHHSPHWRHNNASLTCPRTRPQAKQAAG